jgi:hypothetical protein
MTDESQSFEREYLSAKLTEVQEVIGQLDPDDDAWGKLAELERRLERALDQTRSVSRL